MLNGLLKVRRAWLHIPRAGRYLRPVLRHGTPRKVANMLFAEAEMRLKRTTLRSRPYYYLIDVCNVCTLRCPLCPTGNETIARKQGFMSLAEYRQILDKIKEYALVVSLYNHGEPFLNREVFDIIETTAQSNIATNLSSNFNWPVPVDPKNIVRSGLEYITASIDGTTQATYQQYRVRGQIDEAFENVCALLAARKELRSRTPFVEWQFLVFKHNEHELARARELADELGVDLLRFVSPAVDPAFYKETEFWERWMPENPLFLERNPAIARERGYIHDRPCFYVYRSMVIAPGGGAKSCCFTHDTAHDFGNLLTSGVDEIWNNTQYRSARMLFRKRPPAEPRVSVVCDGCELFRRDGARACGVVPSLGTPPSGLVSISASGASHDPPSLRN